MSERKYHFVQCNTQEEFDELLALGWKAPRDHRMRFGRFVPTIMRAYCEGIPKLRAG